MSSVWSSYFCCPLDAAYPKPEDAWHCFFPQYGILNISQPTYIINSLFDYVAMTLTFHPSSQRALLSCIDVVTGAAKGAAASAAASCSPDMQRVIRSYPSFMIKHVGKLIKANADVKAFIVDGFTHCMTIYPTWSKVTRKGVSLTKAVTAWYEGKS